MIATLLFAATLASASGRADPSPLQAAFGATIVSTYPDGRTARLWLHPDGAYDAQGRRRDQSSGHWSLKGDKVCLRQSRPFPAPFAYCASVPHGGVGASWSGKAVTGESIQLKLVAGRGG